jgi:nucleotide-binding universal stress UspA family protein
MQRFKKIVFYQRNAADHPALDRAALLAKRSQARLTVVEVFEDLPRDLGMANHGTPPTDPVTSLTKERQERLQQLVASLMEDGSQIKTTLLVGTPFLEITREVLREGHDLVIMTGEGPLGLKQVLFGSTSMHLMRKCPCPVWVMKPGPHGPGKLTGGAGERGTARRSRLAGSLRLSPEKAFRVGEGPPNRVGSFGARAHQDSTFRPS